MLHLIPRGFLIATFLPATLLAQGDSRHIKFTLPFEKAHAEAKQGHRLMFLKPIYGGVDKAGAKDYRCGNW